MLRTICITAAALCFSGTIFAQQGLVKSYYGNSDTLKSEINYKNNVREGDAKFYYPNGRLKEELTYTNGKVDGMVTTYFESGKKKEMFNVETGKREGPTSLFDTSGNYIKDITYKNGELVLNDKPVQTLKVASAPKVNGKDDKELNREKIAELKRKSSSAPLPPAEEETSSGVDPAYFLSADVMPEPVGGMKSIMNRLVYPAAAKENKIQGKVEVKVFIDQFGEVTSAEVVKGIGYGCDIAARIAVYYTKFTPGLIKGKPVRVQMIIPVEFQLKIKK